MLKYNKEIDIEDKTGSSQNIEKKLSTIENKSGFVLSRYVPEEQINCDTLFMNKLQNGFVYLHNTNEHITSGEATHLKILTLLGL